jgi:D-aspartate ligase
MRIDQFLRAAERQPPAVALPVNGYAGLEIVRDLGRGGVPMLALDPDPGALGLRSRYAAGATCPDPVENAEALLTRLEDLGQRLPQRAVIFPCEDQYLETLSQNAERLTASWILPFSCGDDLLRARDKRAQMEAAGRARVDTPKTAFASSPDQLEAAADIPFPAVLKPVDTRAFKRRFGRRTVEVASPAELARFSDEAGDVGHLILQERIPGGADRLHTVGAYLDSGSRALAVFTGHQLRQYPDGTCRAAVSKWMPDLADAALRLLQELRFHGVGQVEFKQDPRDGRFCLVDIKTRYWPWHGLSTASGVNLSLAAYSDSIGRPFVAPHQTDGVKWIVAGRDIPLALSEIVRGRRHPAEYMRALSGTRADGVYSLADPVPALVDTYSRVTRLAAGVSEALLHREARRDMA